MLKGKKLLICWISSGIFSAIIYILFLADLFNGEIDDSLAFYLIPFLAVTIFAVLWRILLKFCRKKQISAIFFALTEIFAIIYCGLIFWYDLIYLVFGHFQPYFTVVIILNFVAAVAFLAFTAVLFKKDLIEGKNETRATGKTE